MRIVDAKLTTRGIEAECLRGGEVVGEFEVSIVETVFAEAGVGKVPFEIANVTLASADEPGRLVIGAEDPLPEKLARGHAYRSVDEWRREITFAGTEHDGG